MCYQERNRIIEQCKQEIARRAECMGMKYDKLEIVSVGCADYGDCVFLKQFVWEPKLDANWNFVLDENGQSDMVKIPTIWAEYPPIGLAECRTWKDGESFMAEFSMPLPKVHIRYPSLVFLVHADGTIKDGAVIPDGIAFDLQPTS